MTAEPPAPASTGLGAPVSQDQVLRNHAVGSTCTVSASGPALVTRTVISTSAGSALAYQTSVIQYRSSSNTPVSSSSYSMSNLPRLPFSARRSSYGNAACG